MPLSLERLAERVEAGLPLSDADIAQLSSTRDIIALGMMAGEVRRKLHPTDTTFVRVIDLEIAGLAAPQHLPLESAGELRIFETPGTLDLAIDAVDKARNIAGDVPVSAFCLFELSKLSEGLPVVLPALRRAGLALIAQAPVDRLIQAERALEAVTDAGLRVARLTIDQTPDRVWAEVCLEVERYQTRLRSIRAFAPLARRIDTTQPTTGYEDVKRVAMSRLLTRVESIQVDWVLYGPKLAQVALTFGADDVDSVAAEDDGSQGHRRSPLEEIQRSIRSAGFEPVERDAHFRKRG